MPDAGYPKIARTSDSHKTVFEGVVPSEQD
jgi:hypothetical protein